MKYWVFQNNQVTGPFDPEQLIQTKGFGGEVLVCPEGKKGTEMGDWKRAITITELADLLQKGPLVATATAAPAQTATPAPTPASLPSDPSIQDLARLGNLQEKISLLEGFITQLKNDLSQKEKDISQLQAKNTDLESKLGSFSGVQDDLQSARKQISDLQGNLQQAREELRRDISKNEQEGRSAANKLSDLEKRVQEMQVKSTAPPPPPPMAPPPAGPQPQISISTPPPSPAPSFSTFEMTEPVVPAFEPVMSPKTETGPSRKLMDLEEAKSPTPDFGIVEEAKPKKKSKGGIFAAVVGVALLATAGVFFISQNGSKPVGVSKPGAPVPAAAPAPQLNVSGEPPKTVPAAAPAPVVDLSKVAEDFVKQYKIPSLGKTLEQQLEGVFPPSGNLSPWFPQKLDEGKYQVNFYVRGTPLVYQFLVETKENRVSGINPPAMAVLNGETPGLPAPPKKAAPPKARRVRKVRARKIAKPAPAPAPKPAAAAVPPPSPSVGSEPSPDDTSADTSAPPASDENSHLSDMLLPGVPKRSK